MLHSFPIGYDLLGFSLGRTSHSPTAVKKSTPFHRALLSQGDSLSLFVTGAGSSQGRTTLPSPPNKGILREFQQGKRVPPLRLNMISQLQFHGMGIKIVLVPQVWLIVFAHVVVNERDWDDEGNITVLVKTNGFQ